MNINKKTLEYKICQNCVMDTSDPDISFNDDGICSWCQTYEKRKRMFVPAPEDREKVLTEMVRICKEKGKGKKYDCVIGVSGGVDSSFVAYKAKELGLRPLAVHLDNGWNSELAVANIHYLLKQLDIDLYTYVLDWEEFKSLQVAFLRASTPDAEIPSDHAIGALMKQMAVNLDVPMLWGVNFNTEAIMPRAWSQGHMDWHYIKKVNRLFGSKRLKDFPHYSVFKRIYWNRIKRLYHFELLNYIEYDKEKAKNFLIENFGWRDYGGKHHESIYTKFYQNYILPIKFGYDKRRAHFSSLILAGQMTREQALKELEKPLYDPEELKEHLDYVPKKLGLTPKEFEDIMNAAPKTYGDYAPNWPSWVIRYEQKMHDFIKNIYHFLLNKKNGK